MKNAKRFAAVLLCVCTALCGCGETQTTEQTSETRISDISVTEAVSAAETTSATEAVSAVETTSATEAVSNKTEASAESGNNISADDTAFPDLPDNYELHGEPADPKTLVYYKVDIENKERLMSGILEALKGESDDIINTFVNAYLISLSLELPERLFTSKESFYISHEPYIYDRAIKENYYQTGYNYESFYRALERSFTEKGIKDMLTLFPNIIEYNGGLWCDRYIYGGDRVIKTDYEVCKRTDKYFDLLETSYYIKPEYEEYDPETGWVEYDPATPEKYDIKYKHYRLVFTNGVWKADAFVHIPIDNGSLDESLKEYTLPPAGINEATGLWQGELPEMDGSTSAAPLDVGLRARALGLSEKEAESLHADHTTTHGAFNRLINGKVELIFTVPVSEQQLKDAEDAGVKLTITPIAKEGFVFVVNADNPVDSLTSEQLRKIYSGEITNWKEVGGNDAEIIVYQRNVSSGSYNCMTEFMGDVSMLYTSDKYIEGSMGSLMNVISSYDNSIDAIGYSVYSYAAQIYEKRNLVKFIAVDGVKPDKKTMNDGTYPLTNLNYVIYTDKSGTCAKRYADWITSDAGQRAVYESGYIPVKQIELPEGGYDIKDGTPYHALGTGEKKPKDYKADIKFSSAGWAHQIDQNYKINILKDKDFEAIVNKDIAEAIETLASRRDKEKESEYIESDSRRKLTVDCEIINGYMSITLGYWNSGGLLLAPEISVFLYDDVITLNYDIFEQKKIEKLSDLFYEGEDFVPWLNKTIADFLNNSHTVAEMSQKDDFMGLIGEPTLFNIESVGFSRDNPYFEYPLFLYYKFDEHFYDISPVGRYRDMGEVLIPRTDGNTYDHTFDEWEYDYYHENGVFYSKARSRFHNEEEIKEKDKRDKKKVDNTKKAFETKFGREFSDKRPVKFMYEEPWVMYKGRYISCNYMIGEFYFSDDDVVYLDNETYEHLQLSDILGENWKNHLPTDMRENNYISIKSINIEDDAVNVNVGYTSDDGMETVQITIPYEEMNHKYINIG